MPTSGGMLLHTPREEIYEITADDRLVMAARELFLDGAGPLEEDHELADFALLLVQEECWIPHATAEALITSLPVLLVGPPGWERDLLAAALHPATVHPCDLPGPGGQFRDLSDDGEVVVACAPRLPDHLWGLLTHVCAASHRPLLTVHREGDNWYTGPFADPGVQPRTSDHFDLRARRLAASACPDALARLWAALDHQPQPQTRPLPDDAHRLLITAGLVRECLAAYVEGLPTPATNTQLGVCEGAEVRCHPVLPLPEYLHAQALR